MHIQAVILAGGKGTRLRPITNLTPKPMVVINGKPFLQYQLEFIKKFGVSEVLLLVGYLEDQIEDYFGDGNLFGLEVEYFYEESPLGTGGALKNAENKLADDFMLMNGDTFLPIDYGELIKYFYQNNKFGSIVVYDNPEKIFSNNIAIDRLNLVIDYNKKCSVGMSHVDAGAMIFNKEILKFIPENRMCSLEEEIFFKLIKKEELVAYIIRNRFYDMGSFQELSNIKSVLK